MKQFRRLLVAALAIAMAGSRMFAVLSIDYAQDSQALQQLRAGTVVAIYSLDKGKYLRLANTRNEEYKYLKPTGTDKNDPFCQFQIVRHSAFPNWLGIKTLQNSGKNLQCNASDGQTRVCRFENHNFFNQGHTWEHWALEPTNPNSLDEVRLRNQGTESWLCVVNPDRFDGRVAGNWAPNAVSGAGTWERLRIEIVQPLGDIHQPGGKDFVFRRAQRDSWHMAFLDKWKFKDSKKGVLKVKIKAPLDAYISFVPTPEWAGAQSYQVGIGCWSNTRTMIWQEWKELDRRWLFENDKTKKGGDAADIITGGWGQDGNRLHSFKVKGDRDWEKDGNAIGTAWDDYWFTYEVADGKVTIAWGKGTIVGKQESMRVVDDNPVIEGFGYLGLGGWFLDVEYKDIQLDPEQTVDEQTISEVKGLEKIEGAAHRIALGRHEGKYLAFMVGAADRKLYRMSPATMGGWDAVEVKDGSVVPERFEDVAMSSDGTVGALADDASLFVSYDGGATWKNKGAPKGEDGKAIDMDRVAIASKKLIAVLDKETADVYLLEKDAWKRIAQGHAMSISAAYPDTLLAINKALDCYKLEGTDWLEFPNPDAIARFAIVDADNMYGTKEKDGRYYLYQFTKGAWTAVMDASNKPVEGIKEVVVNAAGAVMAVNIKGEVLKKGSA